MKYYPALLLTLIFSCNTKPSKKLKEGDLLFKETRNDAISNAISEVTDSTGTYRFSHVGILLRDDNNWCVLEAVPNKGVSFSPLEAFCSPEKGKEVKVVVGRLKSNFPFDMEKLKEYGKKQLGKPYDFPFGWSDTAFYCSELIYKMFVHAEQKKAFSPNIMTFKTANNEHFMPIWVAYFQKHNAEIPEGKQGINPNAMAQSKAVELLFELSGAQLEN